MICSSCGLVINEDTIICQNCGTSLSDEQVCNGNGMVTELELRAFLGKNSDYYIRKWSSGKNPKSRAGWNWAAFWLGVFWLGYRKMYSYALIIFGIFIGLDIVQAILNIDVNKGINAGIAATFGILGDSFYYRHTRKNILKVKSQTLTQDQQQLKIQEAGGTSWRGVGLVFLMFFGYLVFIFCLEFIRRLLGQAPSA